MQIVDILKAAQQQNSSDIHIVPGNPVMLRIDGKLVPQGNQVLTNVETDNLLSPIVPQELKDELKEKGELDFAFSVEGFSRVRANVFRQRGSYAAAWHTTVGCQSHHKDERTCPRDRSYRKW